MQGKKFGITKKMFGYNLAKQNKTRTQKYCRTQHSQKTIFNALKIKDYT